MSEIVYHGKNEHERLVERMPPSPELILEDLPWADPLSDDPEEDRRLRQEKVVAANAAYYRQVLGEYRKRRPTLWMRVLHWWQRIRQG